MAALNTSVATMIRSHVLIIMHPLPLPSFYVDMLPDWRHISTTLSSSINSADYSQCPIALRKVTVQAPYHTRIGPITRSHAVFDVIKISTNPSSNMHAPSHSGLFTTKVMCLCFPSPLEYSICHLNMFSLVLWSLEWVINSSPKRTSQLWCEWWVEVFGHVFRILSRSFEHFEVCFNIPNQVMGQGFATLFTTYMQQAMGDLRIPSFCPPSLNGLTMLAMARAL